MRVFIAAHDDSPTPTAGYLTRLQVGASLAGRQPDCAHDDDGDNISAKNPLYAELTALYWLWKNVEDDIIGLCHYRRYFSPILTPAEPVLATSPSVLQGLLSCDDAGAIFANEMSLARIILPQAATFVLPLEEQYITHHQRPQDWHAMLAALWMLYPEEAAEARRFFIETQKLTQYNMFIAARPLVEAYCTWLFPLLTEIERLLHPQVHPLQHRALGYLAERLFTWWLHSRNPRQIRRPILLMQ